MPITPGCQPSPPTTIAGASGSKLACRSILAIAASRICASTSLRSAFSASSSCGQRQRLGRIVGGQQPRAQVGAADAAAGVDPRAQDEAGMEDAGRPLGAGDVQQRLQAGIAPGRHHLQALGGQRAVEADQLGHVADRAQRGQVQPLAQVRLGPVAEPARAAAPRGSAPPAARR